MSTAEEELGRTTYTLYADMVGDLFHAGHVAFITKAKRTLKEKYPKAAIRLIIGLVGDEVAAAYKRQPILRLEERVALVSELRCVDEVVENCPLVTTGEFMDAHGIDFVAHGDDYSDEAMKKYYSEPVARGAMISVDYTPGISTSDIIQRCYQSVAKTLEVSPTSA